MCYPYWDYEHFSLEYLSSEECLAEFRVSKVDLPRLAEALRVPRRFRSAQGTVCSGAAVSVIRNRNADKFLPKTRLETENKPPRMRIGSKLYSIRSGTADSIHFHRINFFFSPSFLFTVANFFTT